MQVDAITIAAIGTTILGVITTYWQWTKKRVSTKELITFGKAVKDALDKESDGGEVITDTEKLKLIDLAYHTLSTVEVD